VPEGSPGTVLSAPASDLVSFAVRKAAMDDIPQLLRLINGYAGEGIMLPRTEFEISENLRDFSVIHCGEQLAGCAALHFYTPTTGEIRSLAVDASFHGGGAGRMLVEALEREAQAFGLQSVFAFTYIPLFFAKLGFTEIERGDLPLKAWKDCLRCPKFQCCDEVAVIKHLAVEHTRVDNTYIRGVATLPTVLADQDVVLPAIRKSR
jgi:amino-acid N-acetyltransferase